MTSGGDQPFIDAQTLTDTEAHVYEAIATLEYANRPVTEAEIAAVAGVDHETIHEIVSAFAESGMLVRTEGREGPVFELARRDWSAAPDTPSHDPEP
jgi:DNA-binding GntR family transcriptional regulator